MGTIDQQADESGLTNRIFKHDAFLSHRIGDGACKLFEVLSRLGCKVWYDSDEPITNRRIIKVLEEQFSQSRMVVAHLSCHCVPSPWTRLEILAALTSEQECSCTRLILYTPDADETAKLESLGLDEYMCRSIGPRRLFTNSSIEELATCLREANVRPGPARFPPSKQRSSMRRRRKLDRLVQALSELGRIEATHVDGEEPPMRHDRADIFGQLMLEHFRDDLDLDPMASHELFVFRCGEINAAEGGERRTDQSLTVTRAIASLAAESDRGDDRANAYMLLELLSRHYDDLLATRFLRVSLEHEPDWDVARCVMPDTSGTSPWWPARLEGVERERLVWYEQGIKYVEADLRPLLAEVVRLKLMANASLRTSDLPDHYQVDLELHWLKVLTKTYMPEPIEWESGLTEAGGAGSGGIELELCMRRLFPIIARRLESFELGQDETIFLHALHSCEEALRPLIEVSERNGGQPLSEFSTYFVDYLLPLLGLFVQYCEVDRATDMSGRAITIIGVELPHEAEAYRALISDCTAARASNTQRSSMPIHCKRGHIQNDSPSFRKLWLAAAANRRGR